MLMMEIVMVALVIPLLSTLGSRSCLYIYRKECPYFLEFTEYLYFSPFRIVVNLKCFLIVIHIFCAD